MATRVPIDIAAEALPWFGSFLTSDCESGGGEAMGRSELSCACTCVHSVFVSNKLLKLLVI